MSQTRLLMLGETVDGGSVKGLIQNIIEFNMYDDAMEAKQKEYDRKPIVMIINSFGGSAYDGFGLIDAMVMSETPIITICLGSAMSAAFAIFLAGTTRLVGKNSTLMYHEVASWNTGKLTEQKIHIKELERLQVIYDNIITSKTSVLEEKLESVRAKKEEWYITAEEAVKLGIANDVISEPVAWA